MTKYDEQFRLKLAREGADDGVGIRQLVHKYGVDHSILRRWISTYRIHGAECFQKMRNKYDADFKMSVLQRVKEEGLSGRQAMAIFRLGGPGLVLKWQRLYDLGGIEALKLQDTSRSRMPGKKKTARKPIQDLTHAELIEEVAYLRAETDFLKKIDALIQEEQAKKREPKRRSSKD